MATSLELHFGAGTIDAANGEQRWHITELSLGEVETIRRALHRDPTVSASLLAMALDRAVMNDPAAIDYHAFVETPIEQL